MTFSYEPEGEPIETADAFLYEMSTDGDYYLEADITLDESYESGCFYGTLDGNGHTVTLSGCPMFSEFAGTLKNTIIEGKVSLPKQDAVGSVCISVLDDATFENVVVRADVASKSGNAGGLVGQIDSDQCTVAFSNCVNEGTVTGKQHVGGLVGYSKSLQLSFTDCENHGEITSNGGNAGGLVGYFGISKSYKAKMTVSAKNCINTGNVSGASSAGGLIGCIESSNAVLDKCANSGEVSSDGTAAGIIASAGSGDGKVCLAVSDCSNVGDAGGGTTQYAAGIIGKATCAPSPSSKVKNCSNFGMVSASVVGAQIITLMEGAMSVEASLAAGGDSCGDGTACVIGNLGDLKDGGCAVSDIVIYGFNDGDTFELRDDGKMMSIGEAVEKSLGSTAEEAALGRLLEIGFSMPYLHDGGMALGISGAVDSPKTRVSVRVCIQKGLYDIIKSEIESVGILIADGKTVNSLGGLTLETLKKYDDKNGGFFLNEPQSTGLLSERADKYDICAELDGKKVSGATVCAVGYILFKDGTVKYGNIDRMSVAELATRALEDVSDESDGVYRYQTDDEFYSPYSPEFREKLDKIANG